MHPLLVVRLLRMLLPSLGAWIACSRAIEVLANIVRGPLLARVRALRCSAVGYAHVLHASEGRVRDLLWGCHGERAFESPSVSKCPQMWGQASGWQLRGKCDGGQLAPFC